MYRETADAQKLNYLEVEWIFNTFGEIRIFVDSYQSPILCYEITNFVNQNYAEYLNVMGINRAL